MKKDKFEEFTNFILTNIHIADSGIKIVQQCKGDRFSIYKVPLRGGSSCLRADLLEKGEKGEKNE